MIIIYRQHNWLKSKQIFLVILLGDAACMVADINNEHAVVV